MCIMTTGVVLPLPKVCKRGFKHIPASTQTYLVWLVQVLFEQKKNLSPRQLAHTSYQYACILVEQYFKIPSLECKSDNVDCCGPKYVDIISLLIELKVFLTYLKLSFYSKYISKTSKPTSLYVFFNIQNSISKLHLHLHHFIRINMFLIFFKVSLWLNYIVELLITWGMSYNIDIMQINKIDVFFCSSFHRIFICVLT